MALLKKNKQKIYELTPKMLMRKSERTAPKKPKIFFEPLDKESNLNKVLSSLDWLINDINIEILNIKNKRNIETAFLHNFKTKETRGGKWSFNLVAGNNKVVATSQSYADRSSMNKGIKSVMTNAPKLKIS